jgi:trehalose 6-phosphate synthase/phosphatase
MSGRTSGHFDRLVLVSYRLPFRVLRNKVVQSAGGLVSATLSLTQGGLPGQGGRLAENIVWVGKTDDSPKRFARVQEQCGPFELVPVHIESYLDGKYYGGFCNDMIWPLFHYFPSLARFDASYFDAYREAHEVFLTQVMKVLRPTDLVWVHDYHLMLLPRMIRREAPDAYIGFFLHIPFPSFEVFRIMPRVWREAILQGILGADVAGFHTFDYSQYFIRAVSRTLGIETGAATITVGDHIVRSDAFPLGIDYARFHDAVHQSQVEKERQKLRRILGSKKLIFSVDRLDYSKGLLHRLEGFEYFLEKYPQWREKIVFNMVVVPSRDTIASYRDMKKEIEAMVGRINGKYGSMTWRPIVYQYRSLSFPEMVALYSTSDIGLITPVRDGMNLVAKEYLASQRDSAGVLIISEMTGAAAELTEAIQINPTDRTEIATAIAEALEMPEADRREHLERMQKRLRTYDIFSWARDVFDTMERARRERQVRRVRLLNRETERRLLDLYQKANRRIIFLDYDGTLVPFTRNPDAAVPDERVMARLNRLAADPKNSCVIVSGRGRDFLEKWFGEMPISLISEHGAFIRKPGQAWAPEVDIEPSWKKVFLPVMQRYADRCSGAFIENKAMSLVWHYRSAEPDAAKLRSQELKDELRDLVSHDNRLQVMEGHKIVEIKPSGYDKGSTALKLIGQDDYDFILAIGDDKTDEDLFRVLPQGALTFRIGITASLAKYNLRDQQQVAHLMDRLLE